MMAHERAMIKSEGDLLSTCVYPKGLLWQKEQWLITSYGRCMGSECVHYFGSVYAFQTISTTTKFVRPSPASLSATCSDKL